MLKIHATFRTMFGAIIFIAAFSACNNAPTQKVTTTKSPVEATPVKGDKQWWKEAVVYQIYPRSFKDSNGDGVGDLKGLTSKLDYVKSLGVDVIWLNPIFSSPNDDNGYDISDYQDIMNEFGTMADFDSLLLGMHQRGLKVVLDLVVNHCSSEHKWFKEARKSRDNPYRNYFHWWNAERGKPNPRHSDFDVNGDAWKYDSLTNSYYLHYFSEKQPDLNWENPKLREEIFSMMRFWFDKGIDGFRMDVIPIISKDTSFPKMPAKYNGNWFDYYADGPHAHEYLHEMNEKVLSKYDVMSVAEGAGVNSNTALLYVDESRKELNMLYNFEGVSYGYLPGQFKAIDPKGYKLKGFKDIYTKWDSVFAQRGWGTIYLGNHDQPRMVTRWGNDAPAFKNLSSEMLTTFLLTMRATPYYYFGDELAMNNIKFDKIEDYRDIESINNYKRIKKEGGDMKKFIENQKISARDNGRTPFQWDATANAGFTTGTPWIKTNPNYTTVNVSAQENDPKSPLNYFRKAVKMRKANPTLTYGKYDLVDYNNPNVYAYTRSYKGDTCLVLLNFSTHNASVKLPTVPKTSDVLINNYDVPSKSVSELRPYEAIVYQYRH